MSSARCVALTSHLVGPLPWCTVNWQGGPDPRVGERQLVFRKGRAVGNPRSVVLLGAEEATGGQRTGCSVLKPTPRSHSLHVPRAVPPGSLWHSPCSETPNRPGDQWLV